MALIEIDHVTKTYRSKGPTKPANDDVSLRVEEGQVYGIFGHNGAGKTTLVNQMLGLLTPDEGSIVIAGEDVVARRERGRFLCSVQPQAKTPLGELTPRAVTRIMGRLRGASDADARRRSDELFDRLDIGEWADVPGNRLSGGVLRLTGFCMAAVQPGRAVILDEPTNDVDPVRRRYLWSAIRDLARDGTAVLLVTHSIREAESAVDEVAVLDSGKVLVQGNVREIRESAAGNLMKVEAAVIDATGGSAALDAPAWTDSLQVKDARLTVSFDRSHAAQALEWASQQQQSGQIGEWALSEITLEDIYVDIVGGRNVVPHGN